MVSEPSSALELIAAVNLKFNFESKVYSDSFSAEQRLGVGCDCEPQALLEKV